MKPPSAKTHLLPHTRYHTTKEPAIASYVSLDNNTCDNDPNRLFKGKLFVEHVKIGMLLVYLEITHFDAESDFRDSRRIIHPSDVDGSQGGGRPR